MAFLDTNPENISYVADSNSLLHTRATKEDFALDAACSQHTFYNRDVFKSYQDLTCPQEIKGYAGLLQAKGKCDVVLQCFSEGKMIKIGFKDVLYVPDAPMNLLSFGQLYSLHPIQLAPEGFSLGSPGILAHKRRNNLYTPDIWKEDKLSLVAAPIEDTLDVWHARLAHLGEQNVKRLVNMSLGLDLTKPLYKKDSCQECSIMQGRSKPHSSHISPGTYPNDLVHSD